MMQITAAMSGVSQREQPGVKASPRLLEITLFGSLLGLIFLTAIPYGTVQPWWVSAFNSCVFALGAVWAAAGIVSGGWRLRGLWLFAPVAAIIILAFAQSLPVLRAAAVAPQTPGARAISADPFETRFFALRALALLLAAQLLWNYTSGRRRLKALVNVIIAAGLVSAVYGIARQTMQGATEGFLLPGLDPGVGYGQFINRNHFAYLMEMSLGLLLGLVVAGGVARDRILMYLAVGAPIWAALVLSNSRGGIFAMLCQVLFLALAGGAILSRKKSEERDEGAAHRLGRIGRSPLAKALLAACLLSAVVFGVVVVGGDPLANRLESIRGEVGTAVDSGDEPADVRENTNRLEIWRATWKLVKAHPV
ncbi:MAG: O-antigen ligase family protein, partial [Acidobacteriota bacterium]|nr:O-antigen ligase family protein [Acidobacteriota bacterium]